MPAGRKIPVQKQSSTARNTAEIRARNGVANVTSQLTGASITTKGSILHQVCPMTPHFTALGFELFYLAYALCTLFVQYLNIYKLNYHLVDYQEVLVIALFLTRRIAWIVFKKVIYLKKVTVQIVIMAFFQGLALTALVLSFLWLIFQLYRTTSFTNILLLFLYPTATYLWVFGFTMELKLQRLTPKVNHLVADHSSKTADQHLTTSNVDKKNEVCDSHPKIVNLCTLSPDVIRSEAEGHRMDFNFKVKQALFQSFICAYYVGFLPMRFSKRFFVYYDIWWTCQYVIFVWITSLILLMKYLAPLQYCDTLHKCAIHLGCWEECDEEDETPPNPRDWSALTSWPQDTVVNYKNKGLYRSQGIQNVADPGDCHHWRFYFVFQSAVRLTNWLLCVLGLLIFYQLVLLCKCPLWHEVVSLSLLLLFNYAILHKLLRDRWVAMAMELKPP